MNDRTAECLPAVELAPPTEAQFAVIWLHGLGANGHDFPPIVPELGLPADLPVRWIFPHARSIPVTVNGGMVMPAWYDIRGMDSNAPQDAEGVRRSSQELVRLIERENGRGVPSERIVLAGFSQGGAVATHTALRHPEPLAGLVALSTYAMLEDTIEAERHEANARLSVFQAHGTSDPMVIFERGEHLRDLLTGLGHDVEWHEYGMVHQVCLEEVQALGTWFAKRLVPSS